MVLHNRPEKINSTTAFCIDCNTRHPAFVERKNNVIQLHVFCPRKEKIVQLSSDAEAFLHIREKSTVAFSSPSKEPVSKWTYVIEITNDCNFNCPICFNTDTRNRQKIFLDVDEVLHMAASIPENGRKSIILSGGEPTCHPELPAIISNLSRRGFKVSVATNGVKISQDAGYFKELKKSGVNLIWLTIDTIDECIHRKMRGCSTIKEKQEAAELIVRSGVRLGINYAATTINLPDLENVLRYLVSLTPALSALHITIASPVGIYELQKDTILDRETVMRAIADMKIFQGRTNLFDFLPLPGFKPWGAGTHPDCSANLICLSDNRNKTFIPLNRFMNLSKLYARLRKSRMKPNFVNKNVIPIFHALAVMKSGHRGKLLRHLAGLITGRGGKGIFVLSLTTFITQEYQDDQRLCRCSIGHITRSGEIISPCIYNHPERLRSMYGKKRSI